MKKTIILTVVLSFWAACSESNKFSYDAALRPGLENSAQVVAKILLFKGKVTLETNKGKIIEARPELPLLESDEIKTPDDGFALLQLQNMRLLRVDKSVSLLVANAAGLRLPPVNTPLEQQLTQFLSPTDLEQTERIVGWHARMAAAETVAVQTEEAVKRQKAPALNNERTKEQEPQTQAQDMYAHKDMKNFGEKRDREKTMAPERKVLPSASRGRRSAPKPKKVAVAPKEQLIKEEGIKIAPPARGLSLDSLGTKKSVMPAGGVISRPKNANRAKKKLHFKIEHWAKGKITGGSPPKELQEFFAKITDSPCVLNMKLSANQKRHQIRLQIIIKDGHVHRMQSNLHSLNHCLAQFIHSAFGDSHESEKYVVGIKAW